jgi:hypothetical protein
MKDYEMRELSRKTLGEDSECHHEAVRGQREIP